MFIKLLGLRSANISGCLYAKLYKNSEDYVKLSVEYITLNEQKPMNVGSGVTSKLIEILE